jgi:Ca2+-binding EF-hand superfamily protein
LLDRDNNHRISWEEFAVLWNQDDLMEVATGEMSPELKAHALAIGALDFSVVARKLRAAAYTGGGNFSGGVSLAHFFSLLGDHQHAELRWGQFKHSIRHSQVTIERMSDEVLASLFLKIDVDGSGTIEFSEFERFIEESAAQSGVAFKHSRQLHEIASGPIRLVKPESFATRGHEVRWISRARALVHACAAPAPSPRYGGSALTRPSLSRRSLRRTPSLPRFTAQVAWELLLALQRRGLSCGHCFHQIDADHSGTISRTEFIRGLRDVAGLEFTTDDTNALLHVLDRDHDNSISWHEFALLFEPSRLEDIADGAMDGELRVKAHIPDDVVVLGHRLRAAAYELGGVHLEGLFAHIDKNHDGTVSFTEFRDGIRGLSIRHEKLSDVDVAGLFLYFDSDNDGTITSDEFVTLVEALNSTWKDENPERDPLSTHRHDEARFDSPAAAPAPSTPRDSDIDALLESPGE